MCVTSGLPPSGSWQDLKDHMREAGDICYADVFNDGTGAVEFIRYDDMKYAVKHLNDTKFKSHEVSFIIKFVLYKYNANRLRQDSRQKFCPNQVSY